ncbi:ribonucleoprotein PTB-binding 2 isoform X2 [Zootoca vivipara]|uniref:ribonucleoprotein PTB-binding 2 isoform X2 n=1 Tax=Zootoca vivipara TaxID=8524 RepID=UPI00293C016D|nr:ribonucleoprotein PTB-binding 2 isoform X2 [Zootoca vivipara]
MAASSGSSGAELPGTLGEAAAAGTPCALAPEEIARRLRGTRRELSNRRKILLRNLPAESSSQEIHNLLKDFELKYCYVDKNKRTAFVTLLNGEQAQNAIRLFHQYSLRGKEISVQLQPTDALLCITNLPRSYTLQEFEELVRPYGNVERHFLIYSEITGYSKGYGFVEYMKKDSAAKARLDLLGKQVGGNALFAQWMDVNQLTPELIHSKCLCVENLPTDYTDAEDLMQTFSSKYNPVFYQLAQDEDSSVDGFAVVEYETAEQAEEVQQSTDGLTFREKRVHVSYCAPGAPGRGTLATLIAAQRMMRNNRKGLLPEPNAVQIMKSLNTPAMLQMLLQPQLHGCSNKLAVLGAPMSVPHLVNPSINPAFLHFNNVHQICYGVSPNPAEQIWGWQMDKEGRKFHCGPVLGNASSLLLQNLSNLQLAQLAKIENIQTNSKPGLLGEAPAVLLQTMLGMGAVPSVTTDMGGHGDARNLSNRTAAQTPVATGIGMLPFFPNQHVAGQAVPRQNNTQDKLSTAVGLTEGTGSGSQGYLQSLPNVAAGGLRAGHLKQQGQAKSPDSSLGSSSKTQTSLLGEPPKEIHLSTNPYLNLASVLPSVCLSAAIASKASNTKQQAGLANNSLGAAAAQGTTAQQPVESYFNYSPQYEDYTQDSVQQWYQQYAQAYHTIQTRVGELENGGSEESDNGVYGDFSSYLQVMPSYYATTQGSFHPGILPLAPQNPLKMTPIRNEKRGSSYLITTPEDGPVEYVGQQTQGSGVHYAELYLKRKRVY